MEYVFELGRIPESKLDFIGGKALSLDNMIKNVKLRIPEGFVLTSEAFNFDGISSEANKELEDLIKTLDSSCTYAVRSSALGEDGNQNSFAGQYETQIDVPVSGIKEALDYVIKSADNARVKEYTESFNENQSGIAVVIQRFIKPEFAGVVFTSDVITGDDTVMVGNYVKGVGEDLVSGSKNAVEFRFKDGYIGEAEFKHYASELQKYCSRIFNFYAKPMDIEWAASNGKVYILQARPITTLQRIDISSYKVNGSMSSLKLLTKTNVGEIFMKPITPMTFSALEKINSFLHVPDWLDNIYGQPYMNISVMCSMLVSFGMPKEKAYLKLRDLVGNMPDGLEIPLTSFDKKAFIHNIKSLFFSKKKSKLNKASKLQIVDTIPSISREIMAELKDIKTNDELKNYWDVLLLKLNDILDSILTVCGTSMVPLFSTRGKIARIAGEEMANSLCGGSVGVIDCMKPLLLLEDVIDGKLSADEYKLICGHRSINEMELSSPRPYENPGFLRTLINEHKKSGVNVHLMQQKQAKAYEEALAEFKAKYPSKAKWIDKEIAKFSSANKFREDIRSKGVWLFSAFREFLLAVARVNLLGDDVFMLMIDEVFEVLDGNTRALKYIPLRKETYAKYCTYPSFPSLVLGRFDPDIWLSNENRRMDFYSYKQEAVPNVSSAIKGFPGAFGVVKGKVRVITDINKIDEIEKGDILVTTATNIGWTLAFPKVSAIITDIGAPLSHAAIVAREFGIPAIVGCGNATTVLKTGDVVTVDGSKGVVYKE